MVPIHWEDDLPIIPLSFPMLKFVVQTMAVKRTQQRTTAEPQQAGVWSAMQELE